ncbi:MAG: hypothetical protein ACK5KM_02145 [Hyphomicrobiaceae bacterium]
MSELGFGTQYCSVGDVGHAATLTVIPAQAGTHTSFNGCGVTNYVPWVATCLSPVLRRGDDGGWRTPRASQSVIPGGMIDAAAKDNAGAFQMHVAQAGGV